MIVCSCNVLSDHDVRSCLAPGPDCPFTPAQVYRCLGCSPQCGRCARTIREIMDAALPSVHGTCTTQCSARCPLSAEAGEPAGGVEITGIVEVRETADSIEIREFIEVRERVGA